MTNLRWWSACAARRAVLRVGDVLHPVDHLPVERFLNGDVRHRRGGRRAVPVLLVRRAPDHVPGPDLLHRAPFALHEAEAGGDDERLAEWMGVPRGARTGLEG